MATLQELMEEMRKEKQPWGFMQPEEMDFSQSLDRSPAADPSSSAQSPVNLTGSAKELWDKYGQTAKETVTSPEISPESAEEIKSRLEDRPKNTSVQTEEALTNYADLIQDAEARYKPIKEEQDKIKTEYSGKLVPKTQQELIARLIIGLAPQLIGAAAGKAMNIGYGAGGAAGGEAAMYGLKKLDEAEKERKEDLTTKYKLSLENSNEKEKEIKEELAALKKARAQVPLSKLKMLNQLALQDPELFLKVSKAERERTVKQEGVELGEGAKSINKKEEKLPPQARAGAQKLNDNAQIDLGWGFKFRPGAKVTDSMLKNAQELVTAYGDYKPAAMATIKALETFPEKKAISRWQDLGSELANISAALKSSLITLKKRGAALSRQESELIADLGWNFQDSTFSDKFRSAFRPKDLADRIKRIDDLLRKQTTGSLATYGGYDAQRASVGMTPELYQRLTKENPELLKKYNQANKEEKGKILQSLQGK